MTNNVHASVWGALYKLTVAWSVPLLQASHRAVRQGMGRVDAKTHNGKCAKRRSTSGRSTADRSVAQVRCQDHQALPYHQHLLTPLLTSITTITAMTTMIHNTNLLGYRGFGCRSCPLDKIPGWLGRLPGAFLWPAVQITMTGPLLLPWLDSNGRRLCFQMR